VVKNHNKPIPTREKGIGIKVRKDNYFLP